MQNFHALAVNLTLSFFFPSINPAPSIYISLATFRHKWFWHGREQIAWTSWEADTLWVFLEITGVLIKRPFCLQGQEISFSLPFASILHLLSRGWTQAEILLEELLKAFIWQGRFQASPLPSATVSGRPPSLPQLCEKKTSWIWCLPIWGA